MKISIRKSRRSRRRKVVRAIRRNNAWLSYDAANEIHFHALGWDDTFVNALCDPPETFTFGGVFAHIMTS